MMLRSIQTSHAAIAFSPFRPFAAQRKATVENIELLCSAHNAYGAQLFFTGDVAWKSDVDSFWNELPPFRAL